MANVLMKSKKRGPAAYLVPYKLTEEEWFKLEKQFNKLCIFQARSLVGRNMPGSHTDDYEDIEQEMRQHVVIAAMYHKRQCFIERSFDILKGKVKSGRNLKKLEELYFIWKNKNILRKQKFGREQEIKLQELLDELIDEDNKPKPSDPLNFNEKFITYCKQITWNRIRTLGKIISKNKSIRSGSISLSEFDYLPGNQ